MTSGRTLFAFQLQFNATNELLHDPYLCKVEEIIEDCGGVITQKTTAREEGDLIANITVDTDSPKAFWTEFRRIASADHALLNVMIVVCEGYQGWDDYRLLHHHDVTQQIDEIS